MPKSGRKRSDPQKSVLGVEPEQERDSEIRAASPDQSCQTLPLETRDRKIEDKIETQANRRPDTRHERQA